MKDEIIDKGLDVANKAVSLATKIYDDGLSKPTKTISNGLNMCLNFLGATFSPMMYEYIQNAEYKKKQIDQKLHDKYIKIPENKRTNPRMNILGPAVEVLKYNLDEKYIKDIFVNIMTNEMNIEKQGKVLPSYIEIVKQLSREDTQMLCSLYELYKSKGKHVFPLDIIRAKPLDLKGYIELDKYVIGHATKKENTVFMHTIKLNPIVIDNLSRLEIVKLYDEHFIPENDDYEVAYESLKKQYVDIKDYEISYEKGIFEITEYGKNFIEVCFE